MKRTLMKLTALCAVCLVTLSASAGGHPNYLCFTAGEGGATIALNKVGTPTTVTIEYQKNGITDSGWTAVDFETETTTGDITLAADDFVYFRNASDEVTGFSKNSNDYYQFAMTGSIAASGNVMSLVDQSSTAKTIPDDYCFCKLFNNCTSLTTAPKLPAITLANYCYQYMFNGCTSLTTAPELPAETLADKCYQNMFRDCAKLETAPELPATKLAGYCYTNMFRGCAALAVAPKLPATTLANYCYQYMFYDCTSLTTAPELPAETLANNCYQNMFRNCAKLETAPELPATTLADKCYQYMFKDCTSLNHVKVGFTEWGTADNTTDWLNGVATTGTFTCPEELSTETRGASTVPEGWTVQHPKKPDYLCFTANTASSTVALNQNYMSTTIGIQYSTNGTDWKDYTIGSSSDPTIITLANAGDKVYFRNASDEVTNFSKNTSYGYYYFSMEGSIAASGSVMSLVDKSCQTKDIPCNYCFSNLFNNCTALTKAPELPATSLAEYCYYNMFYGCTALTAAPELPATTLNKNCYNSMFYDCTALIAAPELPATTLASNCYNSMFYDCTKLTTAPELPATTLVQSCYAEMFSNCAKLTAAPELPATTLDMSCYNCMFYGCESLTTAPELPATTLANSCYTQMFYGCKELTDIKVAFTTWTTTNATNQWVSSVTTTGTFTCPAGLTKTTGTSNIPSNWTTIQNTYDVTIASDKNWTSLCVNLPLQVPEGVEVYYASAFSGSTITLTQIGAGTVMAPRTAVIVKGTGTVSFPISSATATSYDGNLFQGSSVAKACNEGENYVLNASMSSDDNVHFSIYNGTELTGHKAWLPMSAVSGASSIQFRFDDATAITTVEMENCDDAIYNMAGQRVSSDYRGIVIKNGKKMYNL